MSKRHTGLSVLLILMLLVLVALMMSTLLTGRLVTLTICRRLLLLLGIFQALCFLFLRMEAIILGLMQLALGGIAAIMI